MLSWDTCTFFSLLVYYTLFSANTVVAVKNGKTCTWWIWGWVTVRGFFQPKDDNPWFTFWWILLFKPTRTQSMLIWNRVFWQSSNSHSEQSPPSIDLYMTHKLDCPDVIWASSSTNALDWSSLESLVFSLCFFLLLSVGVDSSMLAAVHLLVSLQWKSPCKSPEMFPSIPFFFTSGLSTVLRFHRFSYRNLPALTASVYYRCQAVCFPSTRTPLEGNWMQCNIWSSHDIYIYICLCDFCILFFATSTDSDRDLVIS